MFVPLWIVWPFILVGMLGILGLAIYGTAWLWWEGIELWMRWHRMKPDLVVAYFDVIQKRKNSPNDPSSS